MALPHGRPRPVAAVAAAAGQPEEERRKDWTAAQLLDFFLSGEELPRYVPGEPRGLAPALAAPRAARELLLELGELYGVEEWNEEAFREFVLGRALKTWKPGTVVTGTDGRYRVAGAICPVLPAAARDPRACRMCQLVQEAMARGAAPEKRVEVAFPETIVGGGDRCVAEIRFLPRRE